MMMTPRNKKIANAVLLASAIAIPAEGLRQYAYNDPVGILTVCYGTTTNVKTGKKYTLDECKLMLNADMLSSVETVYKVNPNLSDKTLAAFADAVYNIGGSVVSDKSTLGRKLKAGDVNGACLELNKWNKATIAGKKVALPGLTKRRQAETNLCLEGLNEPIV